MFINLINNATDAIEHLEKKWIKVKVLYGNEIAKDKIIFKVIDSGAGIPIEIREKIHIPFFSTKAIGKGSGLGLSICDGIVQRHNGKFYVDEKAENTTFVIELPQ